MQAGDGSSKTATNETVETECVMGAAQAKITLVRLYQRFTFELQGSQDPLELRETITISAANGVHVKAVPRPPSNNLF